MRFSSFLNCLSFLSLIVLSSSPAFPQTPYSTNTPQPNTQDIPYSQQTNYTQQYTNTGQYTNYMSRSTAFKQEIARVEINVVREGMAPLSITEVPRLVKNDVLKVRLLEEQINGVMPDQSNYDWTFLVAFVNPSRNTDDAKSVSEEIQFKRTGWYKEYSFVVPYDSQPIFFLYPKSNYRAKILDLIQKNQEDIRKIGEKTIEISNAYARIGSFLNELQYVINRSQYNNGYGNYGAYSGGYGNYGYSNPGYNFNAGQFTEQSIERLARSFNIQLPGCWGNTYDSYANGSNNNSYNSYNNYNSYGGYGMNNNLVGRAQCVAQSVRLEDLDLSLSKMLQQGGILAAAQLAQKYPQIAHWINIAAVAIDLILKLTKKTPLKIVPTVISTNNQTIGAGYQQNSVIQNNYSQAGFGSPNQSQNRSAPIKISLYAETSPNANNFVTAYPLVVHKWQSDSDPDVITFPTPMLAEACLSVGQNLIRSTDLTNDWASDTFAKDFRLIVSSNNGFRKEFSLRKNAGLNGWEFILTKEDLNAFPKINMILESEIVGKRGFNEIRSPKFALPLPVSGAWEIEAESQKGFAAGGKRTIILKNRLGNCRCLQAVVYKPSFGGEFVFEANAKENKLRFSEDGREVSFEVDATNFQPGPGQLELKQFGGDASTLTINLNQAPPIIADVKFSKGDNQAVIYGERLEQVKAVKINGKRAVPVDKIVGTPVNDRNGFVNEGLFVFQDPSARHDSNVAVLEIELEGGRIYQTPQTFSATLSRPKIIANNPKEVEAFAVVNKTNSQLALFNLPIFPINTTEVSVNLQNALTDYDFKIENLEVETRIENSQINPTDLPKASFEVLDWKNMRVTFKLDEQSQKFLGGRRLQFRIKDRLRGESDWYTLRKTFVRTPEINSVTCANKAINQCEMKGQGLEYIKQVSVDGGKTWYPGESEALMVQPAPDGKKTVMIPSAPNLKLLQIRLRDLPATEGLGVYDYGFWNLGKVKK